MKPPFLLVLGALLLESGAFAQAPPSPAPNTSTPLVNSEDQQSALKSAQALMKIDVLWSKPLDWNEAGSSTETIIAHIKKALGNDAPIIDVRAKDTNRSTFVLQGAQLGPTLSSLATLANFQVWAFPGRLVLAPESALTPTERTAIQEGMGGEWKQRSVASSLQQLERVTITLVGAELKDRLAAKGLTPSIPAPENNSAPAENGAIHRVTTIGIHPLPYELSLSELPPDTQTLLQDLLDGRARMFRMPQNSIPKLDSSTIVSFDDTQPGQMALRLQKPKADSPTEREDIAPGYWSISKPRPTTRQPQ